MTTPMVSDAMLGKPCRCPDCRARFRRARLAPAPRVQFVPPPERLFHTPTRRS